MNRPKLVVDTNVFVSAAIKLFGAEATVLDLVAKQQAQLYLSDVIYAEYKDVLLHRKLRLDPERARYVQKTIEQNGQFMIASGYLSISPHEPDNRFLECAEAAGADYLITGNKPHFPDEWKSMKIINARELLDRLNLP